ncbi:MAG: hypothetical protein EBZ48_15030, partial [Proteobacteria bacterium]|nr:hypothetical protein [Pseudomonadota bacterium]
MSGTIVEHLAVACRFGHTALQTKDFDALQAMDCTKMAHVLATYDDDSRSAFMYLRNAIIDKSWSGAKRAWAEQLIAESLHQYVLDPNDGALDGYLESIQMRLSDPNDVYTEYDYFWAESNTPANEAVVYPSPYDTPRDASVPMPSLCEYIAKKPSKTSPARMRRYREVVLSWIEQYAERVVTAKGHRLVAHYARLFMQMMKAATISPTLAPGYLYISGCGYLYLDHKMIEDMFEELNNRTALVDLEELERCAPPFAESASRSGAAAIAAADASRGSDDGAATAASADAFATRARLSAIRVSSPVELGVEQSDSDTELEEPKMTVLPVAPEITTSEMRTRWPSLPGDATEIIRKAMAKAQKMSRSLQSPKNWRNFIVSILRQDYGHTGAPMDLSREYRDIIDAEPGISTRADTTDRPEVLQSLSDRAARIAQFDAIRAKLGDIAPHIEKAKSIAIRRDDVWKWREILASMLAGMNIRS